MTHLGPREAEALRSWIERASGLRGEAYRTTFLERRLAPRLQATGCRDVGAYLECLARDPQEAALFLSKLLVPTTEFFRNPEVFTALSACIAERAVRFGWNPVRILCAPSSTGQEAFTLGILLEEAGLAGVILAADRSLSSLRRLQRRIFQPKDLESMDTRLKARYFTVEEGRARVTETVARRIQPVQCDLTRGLPGRRFHVVAMRNLFIYLADQAQVRLLKEAHEALAPGGLLVLARVEAMAREAVALYTPVVRDSRIYERRG